MGLIFRQALPGRAGRHPEDQAHGRVRALRACQGDEGPYRACQEDQGAGRLPVVNFAAGGVATPADAALMMQLGVDGVFVGSGIFKSGDPKKRAKAIVQATTHYNDPKVLAEVSVGLGEPMVGIDIRGTNFKSYAKRSE